MIENQANFKPLTEKTFRFRCYPGISCFTRCCAALKLVLTPYDVLRMKRRLGLSSDEFLEQHTETSLDQGRFPLIKLKMNTDQNKKCPFVTEQGCAIYEDRPAACRIYPLGRAALKPDSGKETRQKFFIVDESHCLGFQEEKEWTLAEWLRSEGVNEYNNMNDRWLEILSSSGSLGSQKDIPRKIQMFMMASYNLDKFRGFIFKSKFLQFFDVGDEKRKQLASEDVALMHFAFDWLKFSLFGERTLTVKSDPAGF
jgi:Fe-S-cluster containining protein